MMKPRSGLTAQILHLLRPYWPIVLGGIVLGVVGGASVAGLLSVVNRGLYATQGDVATLLFAFAGLCLLILIGSIGADISANYVGQRIIAELRKSLAAKILAAPIDQLEIYRTHRLIPVLTQDVDTISDFAFFFSSFFVSLVITFGCMVYLAMLSWPLFLITGLVIILGSLAHAFARTRGVQGFNAARDSEDELQKHYRAIAEGAKELRLNRVRRQRVYVDQLQRTVDLISTVQVKSINLFVTARALGTMLFFVVIGVALTLRPFLWPDSPAAVSSGFVLVLLYMRGPIDQVIGILPSLGRAQVAMRRIAELSEQFSTPEPDLLAAPLSRVRWVRQDRIDRAPRRIVRLPRGAGQHSLRARADRPAYPPGRHRFHRRRERKRKDHADQAATRPLRTTERRGASRWPARRDGNAR